MGVRGWLGNGRVVPAIVSEPDEYSTWIQRALATLTLPSGPQSNRTDTYKHVGVTGYGMNGNRFAGLTGPLQSFRGVALPVQQPSTYSLGMGAGVSGQPGLPDSKMSSIDSVLWGMSGY
jgi:hypothetical protein